MVTRKGTEKAKPEDPDVIALAAVDDGTKSTISTMFMGRCDNDVISIEGLYDIVREVGLNSEKVLARMSETEVAAITLDVAMLVIGRLKVDAKTSSVVAKEETVVVDGQGAVEVYLPTLKYLWTKLPCVAPDPDTTYLWKKPSLEIQPRAVLTVFVTVLMLVTVFVLTIMMVVVNNNIETSTEEDDVDLITMASRIGGSMFLDSSDQIVLSGYLYESSLIGAALINMFANMKTALQTIHLGIITRSINHTVIAAHQVSADSTLARLRERVESLRTVLKFVPSTHQLKFAAYRLSFDFQVALMAVKDNNASSLTLPYPESGFCSGDLYSSPCLAAAKAGAINDTLVSGEGQECGMAHTLWAGTYVPFLNMTMCLVMNTSSSYAVARTMIDDIVTAVNEEALSLGRPITVEVGVWKNYPFVDGTSTQRVDVYGGRNRTSTTCLVVDDCVNQFEFFQKGNATTDGTVAYGSVMGADVQEWGASYTESAFQDVRYVVGAQIPTETFISTYKDTLLSTFSDYPSSEAAVFIGSTTGLSEVQFLPTSSPSNNPTSAQKVLVRRALRGVGGKYSGVDPDLPTVGGQTFLRGYAPVPVIESGVLTQMTSKQYTVYVVEMMMSVADLLKAQLPRTADVLLFQASVGSGAGGVMLNVPRNPCNPCRKHDAAEKGFSTQSSGHTKGVDINGNKVIAYYTYYPTDPAVVLVVQETTAALDDRKKVHIVTSVIVGIVSFILIQIVMLLMTRRVLNQIEGDYERHKQNIEDEKQQFGDLVKDVMPPMIAKKIMSGTRLIAETHPQLTFFFSDIVGSTETSKTLNNKQLVRMLGYTFMLEDEIASYFNIHKIKTIGDAYFAVSGLEGSSGEWTGKNHQVYRMVSFACVAQQLFGPGFSHYPEKTDCFREAAGLGPNDPVESMRMVRLRMGIHTGPAVAGVVDVGRAPHFDCFGPSVNLASRMESTSTAGRVQISGPSMEILSAIDKEGLFEFETPRKTLVKGYGTMVTYLVKSTNLKVPEIILQHLHIERAQRRHFFAEGGVSPHRQQSEMSPKQSNLIPTHNEPVTPGTPGKATNLSDAAGNSLSLLPKAIMNSGTDSGSLLSPRGSETPSQPMRVEPATGSNTPRDPIFTPVQPFMIEPLEDVKKPHRKANASGTNGVRNNGSLPVATPMPGLAADPFDFNIALPPPPPDF